MIDSTTDEIVRLCTHEKISHTKENLRKVKMQLDHTIGIIQYIVNTSPKHKYMK